MHPALNQVKEQFNLLIASGDYPDLIGNAGLYKGGGEKAVEENVYLKLNDLIENYGPNYRNFRLSNPEIAKQTITDNGVMWCYYMVSPREVTVSNGPLLRQNWLDDLGLEMPVTIDDWYNVLKAFRDEKGCEAPMFLQASGIPAGSVFLSAFDTADDFIMKNGEIKYGPIEPGMKDYLALMNKWYEEGLIDKDFPTRDTKARQAMLTGNKFGAVVGSPSYIALFKQSGSVMGAPDYPVLEEGQKLHYRGKSNFVMSPGGEATTAISTACNYPIEALQWLDYGYTEEGAILFNYGIEGQGYTMVEGEPKFTDFMLNNPDGTTPAIMAWTYKLHEGPFLRFGEVSNPAVQANPEIIPYREHWTETVGTEYVLPFISLTSEEGEKSASIMSEVETYKKEMVLKFILGIEPISKFDQYVSTIEKFGIDEAIKIRQNALERYNKR